MTTVTNPGFIDYDAVERLTQLLVMAAQRKRVVFYWQAVAACQGGDLDLVIRGHIQANKELPPTNETVLAAINHVAQVFKDKAWPPLTTLITKDGKTVSTGFWTNSPLGDLSGVGDDYKRRIELIWREQCYAYFDALSAMNTGLVDKLRIVRKAIAASKTQHPHLQTAFNRLTEQVINGVLTPMSLSSIDALICKGIRLTQDQSMVLSYDNQLFVGPETVEAAALTPTVLLPVGSTRMDFVQWVFKRELKDTGLSVCVRDFEIIGVLSETQEHLGFKAENRTLAGNQAWCYTAEVVMDQYDPNIVAPRTAELTVRVDPVTGHYEAMCSDIRVTNIIARFTAHLV